MGWDACPWLERRRVDTVTAGRAGRVRVTEGKPEPGRGRPDARSLAQALTPVASASASANRRREGLATRALSEPRPQRTRDPRPARG